MRYTNLYIGPEPDPDDNDDDDGEDGAVAQCFKEKS